jgi:hypothetical protein
VLYSGSFVKHLLATQCSPAVIKGC